MEIHFNFIEGGKMKFQFLIVLASIGLASCYQSCAVGDPLGMFTYCPKDARERLNHPEPYRNLWAKAGMTEEGRRLDWVACGGSADGNAMTGERLAGETDDFSAMRRTHRRLDICMSSRGYLYSEK